MPEIQIEATPCRSSFAERRAMVRQMNETDARIAREAIVEIKSGREKLVPWEEVCRELDALDAADSQNP
uniref:Uncharacterized protein n=1 Tax=Candidatus Kentrum sp. FM TaxID=2126340 RepID=A0A450TSA0_9GAMM|nr:MAG: hypothetical protein BECKFM1743C_GA0114222_104391 [Candidatus Kentron sp. FM]VFJ71206.1 MAG: hypothetical protein BECKFM1743A_GA0114220_105794 [Candidatus Kentron sp. FM]VFK18141.1 MAG: hypothetical protein BECKFM1743B_GA0114221_105281 [Candidatus Kentron sp. FM]